jgi:L-histidine N-alpha-methyltransferase
MLTVKQAVVENDTDDSVNESQKKEKLLNQEFLEEVVSGLSKPQKTLPCKYLYDAKGSQLFEAICDTPEYYVTRTECHIYERYAEEMSALMGDKVLLLEPGAGSVKKVGLLLDKLDAPAGFVPMDISAEILQFSSETLSERFPAININPIVIDFLNKQQIHHIFSTLPAKPSVNKRVIFFPGSTIGNFDPEDAVTFLKQFSDNLQSGDGLLIGVDLVKDTAILEAAYDDADGMTAAFNTNLLHRIDRELDANIHSSSFNHRAIFNRDKSRIEMHLVSDDQQLVQIADNEFLFEQGETIHTENSYKYTVDSFSELAERAGFLLDKVWTDEDSLFSVNYFSVV